MWSNSNSHSLLVGMQSGTAASGDNLVVSYKIKHTLTIQSINRIPWYLPKGVKNLHPHKNLHIDINSTFIHNCQNLETTKMSFSRGMDKLWYIQTMEYYLIL